MAKKLTAAELNRISSKFDERKTVYVGGYEINIHTHLRKSTIDEIAIEYLTYLQELNSLPYFDTKLTINTYRLFDTLFLREFTSLPIPKKKEMKNVSNLIKVTLNLLDNDIFVDAINCFSQEQHDLAKERIELFTKNAGQAMDELMIKSAVQDDQDSVEDQDENVAEGEENAELQQPE